MKVAIIGTGGIGKTHLENLRAIPEAEIVSICDVGPAGEAIAKGLGASFDIDYQAMLAATPAEVVLICTPTFLHRQQVRAVLEAGKHCICEKPLCLNAQEAKELFALAEVQGVQLLVAHVLHFWEEYALLSRMVKEKPFGEVLDVSFARLTARPAWASTGWLFDKEKSGLLPFDLHIHDLYYLIGLFGKPRIGYVQSGGRSGEKYHEYLRVCYEYPGITAAMEASWYNAPIPFTQRFRVYFERAVLAFDGERVMLYEQGKPEQNLSVAPSREVIQTSVNVTPTVAFLKELEHFFDCIRQGRPSDIVPKEQVITTLEVLEEVARESGL